VLPLTSDGQASKACRALANRRCVRQPWARDDGTTRFTARPGDTGPAARVSHRGVEERLRAGSRGGCRGGWQRGATRLRNRQLRRDHVGVGPDLAASGRMTRARPGGSRAPRSARSPTGRTVSLAAGSLHRLRGGEGPALAREARVHLGRCFDHDLVTGRDVVAGAPSAGLPWVSEAERLRSIRSRRRRVSGCRSSRSRASV